MILRYAHVGKRGFSLVEMSMVLVIIGAMGMVLWKFIPNFKSLPAIARLTATSLDSAEDALNGYVLANGRLPCPATTVGGDEDCSASPAGQWLPTRSLSASGIWLPLGLNLPEPVRYGVYRNVDANFDLAVLNNRYDPLLPDIVKSTFNPLTDLNGGRVPIEGRVFTDSQVYAAGTIDPQQNGLDFCVALLNIARTPGGALTAGPDPLRVPIAYGLAVAGAGDADGNGSAFDGLNREEGRFELAGAPRSTNYDDESRAVGANELFTRLGCASRLSAVNGAARATYAAYDIDRFADLYLRFRQVDVDAMQGNADSALLGIALSGISVAISAAAAASAILQVEEAKGLSIASAVASVIASGLADAGLLAAIAAEIVAQLALTDAKTKLVEAIIFKYGYPEILIDTNGTQVVNIDINRTPLVLININGTPTIECKNKVEKGTNCDFKATTARVKLLDKNGLLP